MKTKITFLATLLCALIFATGAFADSDNGFYEKDHIRGFISLGGDFRGMRSEFADYVNTMAFLNQGHWLGEGDSLTRYFGNPKYSEFDDYYIGLHLNIGAQYKQFLTWFNIAFMPTQVSEAPASSYDVGYSEGKMPLYDIRWFNYGVDWMFGWKLLGESSFINVIPSVGFGFDIINFHFASNFDIGEADDYVRLRDRYYSTSSASVVAELEVRLEFDPIAIGIYGGYHHTDYNELEIEDDTVMDWGPYDTDNTAEAWFVGLRVTWIFMSDWQKKQANKL